jgi:hypothetical protein
MVSTYNVATSALCAVVCKGVHNISSCQQPPVNRSHGMCRCRCITCHLYAPHPQPATAPLHVCCVTVVLACRSQSKGDAMVKALSAQAQDSGQPAPSLEVSLLDLSSLESVRGFVQRWEQRQRPVHILINNAGLFNLGGEPSCQAGAECTEGQHQSFWHSATVLGQPTSLHSWSQHPQPTA